MPYFDLGFGVCSQWLFLRLMGFVYLCAFLSMSGQAIGLWGARGLLSIDARMRNLAHRAHGWRRFLVAPTLFWFGCSDRGITSLLRVAQVLSVCVLLDVFVVPSLVALWVIWQSFLSVDTAFMRRQSDSLLMEVGIAAILCSVVTPPPFLVTVLLWTILFKFMLMAGAAKLLSGDPSWRDGLALSFHYETQPLPNPLSWYAHQLPMRAHQFCVAIMLATELVVPFFIFTPDWIRVGVWAFFLLLQLGIFATGNFTFLNILSVVLAFPLLSDSKVHTLFGLEAACRQLPQTTGQWVVIPVSLSALALIIVNILLVVSLWRVPPRAEKILKTLMHLHISNVYGLFAVMTRSRNEVVIEGSNDGERWAEYSFRYKPGDVLVMPKQMAPHHPRLDWQMWFAALETYDAFPWFANLMEALLTGQPEVLALLAQNPFPDSPPRFVRAQLYEYRFTNWSERRETRAWWKRRYLRHYSPTYSLPGEDE